MEIREFIQWCVNQYLVLIRKFKNQLYSKDSNFTPYLADRERLVQIIYLTALLNEISGIEPDGVKESLDSLYERVNGNWRGGDAVCMNLWEYHLEHHYGYQSFFIQLFIVENDMRCSGNYIQADWLSNYMIMFPIAYEQGGEFSGEEKDASHMAETLLQILRDYRYILCPVDKQLSRCFCMDYMNVYSFYERYFYLYQFNERKGVMAVRPCVGR